MKHVKELFENATRIGEVTAIGSDRGTHSALYEMADQAGKPICDIAQVALGDITQATDIDAAATRLAPTLAKWIRLSGADIVVAPSYTNSSDRLLQRAVERAVTLAAIRSAVDDKRQISVLVAREEPGIAGMWQIDPSLEGAPEHACTATTYTRHHFRPDIIMSSSVEHHFAAPASE